MWSYSERETEIAKYWIMISDTEICKANIQSTLVYFFSPIMFDPWICLHYDYILSDRFLANIFARRWKSRFFSSIDVYLSVSPAFDLENNSFRSMLSFRFRIFAYENYRRLTVSSNTIRIFISQFSLQWGVDWTIRMRYSSRRPYLSLVNNELEIELIVSCSGLSFDIIFVLRTK